MRLLRHHFIGLVCGALIGGAASLAHAQSAPVRVEDAWMRASVPGQSATGGFMKLTPQVNLALVGLHTEVASVSEVHEMRMDGDVMRMRALPKLDLPAGRTTQLSPGGNHLMLMGLKRPLKAGERVQLQLTFQTPEGRRSTMTVPMEVRALGSPAKEH
ncbi:MAG TPA: copper chaperone PCu(A)C [Burkholderiaceae bacterium]|nr:copper chaperone PCu(A)C [Burkholderiaceae bacterium]